MRKILLMLFTLMFAVVMVACGDVEDTDAGDATDEGTEGTEETEEQTDDTEGVEEEPAEEETEEASGDVREVNETIVDNDNLTATITTVEKIVDDLFEEEYYEVNIDIENKRDDTIEVQAHEVAADGQMIDDMVFFSETVSGGNSSSATMQIQNYEGDLPPMEESLEFLLVAFDMDTFEYEEETPVSIEF